MITIRAANGKNTILDNESGDEPAPKPGDEAKPGFSPNQIGNQTLGPERTREMEVGFETSAYAGRYSMDVTYFDTRTLDALIQVRYPPSQGFLNRQLENVGEIHNSGLEVRGEVGLLRRAAVDWRGRLNYTKTQSVAPTWAMSRSSPLAVRSPRCALGTRSPRSSREKSKTPVSLRRRL